jgi:transposase-like protein
MLQRQTTQARDQWNRQAVIRYPLQPRILLGDALVQRLAGKAYTIYLFLAHPITGNEATVCLVRTVAGHESGKEWRTSLELLPPAMRASTKALVCDGHAGLTALAATHGWVLQRCCFHVLKSLNKNLRLWHHAKPEAYRIHALVHTGLESADDEKVYQALERLRVYADTGASKEVASILRGLVLHVRDFRNYIYYPELHLPRTNNTCESSFRRVRALQSKARGWRSPASYHEWVKYILLSSPSMHCREGETRW